jgi:hypothetical protein
MKKQSCTCKHEFQDKEHGLGIRIFNESKKGTLSCTVCGTPPAWINKIRLHAMQWLPMHTGVKK